MPTGYTEDIYNGKDVTFKDFALKCARAFGACVHQRDDDANDPPKLREPNTGYYEERLKKAKAFKKPTKAEYDLYISKEKADLEKRIEENRFKASINKKTPDIPTVMRMTVLNKTFW